MRHLILSILHLLSAGLLFAQATFNFEQCVAFAYENNLEIRQQNNTERQAAYDVAQSQWRMAPSVNAGSNLNVNLRRSTNQNNQISSGKSYASAMYINGSLNLFNGLTTLNTIKAQKIFQASVQEKGEQLKNELYLDILLAYAGIVYEAEKVKVAENKLKESQEQRLRLEALVQVGKREPAAIDEIKATESGAKLDLQQAKSQLQISLIRLKNLLQYDGDILIASSDFQLFVPNHYHYDLQEVYQIACDKLPQLKEQELKYDFLKKQLAIQYGRFSPSLSVGGGYASHFYSTDVLANGETRPFDEQFENYLNPNLGMSLSIPIFNKMGKRFDVKRTKLQIENQMFSIKQEKNTIQREIEEAVQRLESSRLEFVNAQDYKGFVEKSYQSNKEKYALGLINSTDFVMAQNQLASAQLMLINAQLNCLVQERIVKLYMGERVY